MTPTKHLMISTRTSDPVAATLILVALVVSTSCAKDPNVVKRAYLESGDAYFANKQYKEAIVQYRNAIQRDQRFGEARYKLAEALLRDNDPAKAYHEYVRAADLMPDDVDAQLKVGQMLLLARKFEDAKARAERVLAEHSSNVQAHILLGNALAGSKDFDGAIVEIEEAISVDPDRASSYDNLAILQLTKGDKEAAERAFTAAVNADPSSVLARVALAGFYLSRHRAADAERELMAILEIEPLNIAANRMMALVCLASNRAAQAETYLRTFAERANTVDARLSLADYYIHMNRASEAVPLLTAIGVGDPLAFAAAQNRLALIDYARDKKIEAHGRLDGVLARQPQHAPSLLLKARFLQAEHRVDDALAHARLAADAEPTSARAQFVLGRLYAATSRFNDAARAFAEVVKLNPRAAAAEIELSRVLLASGDVDASLRAAREAVAAQPTNLDALLQLARGLVAHRDLSQADTEIATLVARYPDAPGVQNQAGSLAMAKGDRVAATRLFERALALDARSFDAFAGLVSVDLSARRTAEARSRVEGRLRQTPDDERVLWLAANTFAATGDSVRAKEVLRHAIGLEPSNLQLHALLGRVFLSEAKLDEARAQFEGIEQARPGDNLSADGLTLVAIALEHQNRPAEAQSLYERILASSPRHPEAANNLAWLYAERGANLDVALGLAQNAVREAPDRPEFNDTLGWIYYRKGLSTAALASFRHGVDGDPTDPIYQYHLGLAYAKSGDWAKAKQSLEKALAVKPDFDGSSDARKMLTSLSR